MTMIDFSKLKHKIFFIFCLLLLLLITNIGLAAKASFHTNYFSQFQQGQLLYQAGQLNDAAKAWKEAFIGFKSNRDRQNQGLTLSYLALTYQQLGQITQAKTAMDDAIKLIAISKDKLTYAQVLNNQGELLFNQGQLDNALKIWQKAEKYYSDSDDITGKIGTQLNQARALQMLGFQLRAKDIFDKIATTLHTKNNSELKFAAFLNLGNNLRIIGDYPAAKNYLQQSLDIAKKLNLKSQIQIVFLNLGKLADAEGETQLALDYYRQAALKKSPLQLQAKIYQIEHLVKLNRDAEAEKIALEIQSELANYPLNQTIVYAQIELAHDLTKIKTDSGTISHRLKAAELLAKSQQQAKTLGNPRAESTALGYLGNLYEQTKQWEEAQKLTQQALQLAIEINAPDIAYRWQWQTGRILKATGEIKAAIVKYNEAFRTLQSLRQDLVAINPDVQFSFRESVEPVYREFVDLLLQELPHNAPVQRQKYLTLARETIEALQLAEIANFFREACLYSQPVPIEDIDKNAAVIYPIILPNRLEIILSLPNQPLRHYSTLVSQTKVETAIKQMRQSLRRTSFEQERLAVAQTIYNWLLKPLISDLNTLRSEKIKTLVFILDGNLRNIPIAALHDGEQYLIEKYQIAISPNLQLFKTKPLNPNQTKLLLAGLTQATDDFSSLPGVDKEIRTISTKISSTVLLDQKFTTVNLEAKLKKLPYSIMHLATHGQFSSKATDTFIQTWKGRLNINQLNTLLADRNLQGAVPIELLVLSACQTAQGDERAALGIAGVAARSGARSILASLWTVNDESTADFMSIFYKELLKPGATKASAVRIAQLNLLKTTEFGHPYHWAAFILVGNWL